MQIFLKNWYGEFLRELKQTQKLRIVCPFVSSQILRNIKNEFSFGNFELITRYCLRDFASGVSSLDGLKFSVEGGAMIYGVKDLHSKIYLFDKRVAIISSANFTTGGLINNFECGVLITDVAVVDYLDSHFNFLKEIAGQALTVDMCVDWQEQLSNISMNPIFSSLPDFGASQFLTNNKKNYYVKFFGRADYRATYDYLVREEIDRALSHYACGFSISKKPRRINDGDIIFMARMVTPNNYAIFGRAEAIKFDDKRDIASEEDKIERPFKNDYPVYLRVRNSVFINTTLGNCILLYDLINALGPLSFPTTQAAFRNGQRDVSPYRSLAQQAYVRLTPEAANWLEPKFKNALEQFGKVDSEYIKSLPQSRIKVQ